MKSCSFVPVLTLDLYPTLEKKAAVLCYGLIQNHPFLDGNKRMGVHLCEVILEMKGIKLYFTDEDLVCLGFAVANGTWGKKAI